jgi:hypothetical protein
MDGRGPSEQDPWHPWPVSRAEAARPDASARATARPRGPAPMLLVLALALAGGLLLDATGPGHRIDLLSPPFLAVLGWNPPCSCCSRETCCAPGRATRRGRARRWTSRACCTPWPARWRWGRASGQTRAA